MNFSEQERLVYGAFNNGLGQVYADPLRVWRFLVHFLDGDPNQVLRDMRSTDEPVKFEAVNKMLDAAIQSFPLQPFDPASGAGLCEQDILATVRHFFGWLDEKKKQSATPPMSSAATAAESPAA